jgi:NAD(P)-dependent dehydrogenase (short-subunit alcohol dehydrogenase family)
MAVNVNGPFFTCRLAIVQMLKQGKGSIINIASVGGVAGARAGLAYTTSKHALVGMSKNIGFMYAQKGIRCNAIAPGGVTTHIMDDAELVKELPAFFRTLRGQRPTETEMRKVVEKIRAS